MMQELTFDFPSWKNEKQAGKMFPNTKTEAHRTLRGEISLTYRRVEVCAFECGTRWKISTFVTMAKGEKV